MERVYAYEDLLKSEQWKNKRKEILNISGNKCEWCAILGITTKDNLHIHHNQYIGSRKPWEYDNDELFCLCESCHSFFHDIMCRFRDALALRELFMKDNENKRADDFMLAFVDNFYIGGNGKIYPKFSEIEISRILKNREFV